ncbi:MAG: transglycosylase domain-containing protein, partial [Lachnospiraceae bacterium]|nr:transglycosylase domain-containing protein [Lachnospiraceae bacterium]
MKFDSQEVKNKQQGLTSKKHKKTTKKRVKVVKYILLTLLSIICIGVCTGLGVVVGAAKSTPDITEVNVLPTMYPSVILDDAGNQMIKLSMAGSKRTEATSEEIPDRLKWAFVDIEDERFYQHSGIDPVGILRAIIDNLKGTKEGASTITQQLIKNNVFETGGRERSTGSLIKRKIQEWVLALNLEKQMTKDEILVTYLNTINLGGGNYGVKEAAKYYLNKDLSQLTISECAVLAAITQNPSANNPALHPEKNRQRMNAVLANMLENEHITQAEYDEAMADNVYDRISTISSSTANSSIYSYFVDALLEEVLEDLQEDAGYTYAQAYNAVFSGGLTIYSTQNTQAQRIVETELNNEENYDTVDISYSISWDLSVKKKDGTMRYYNQTAIDKYYREELENEDYRLNFDTKEEADEEIARFKETILESGDEITYENVVYTLQPQASFTLMDYTNGHVLAIVGGRGEKKYNLSQNRATNTTRQPGSTFKIVAAFAPALDTGACTLATTFDDAPFKYGHTDKYIRNWWGDEYRGLHTIRDGIRDSMNIVACKTLYYIGASQCIPYLQSFGYKHIDEQEDANMATAIGGITHGITNLENCAAFASIANKGEYIEPTFYTKIVSRDGKVILEKKQDTHRVIEEETASLLTNAMRDVVRSGTGVKCAIDAAPLAGKTGTTNNTYDIWFVGYVPNGLCSCIWIGYDANGITIQDPNMQKPFYSRVMNQLVEALDRGDGSFEMTGDIVQATVCNKSGLRPNEFCGDDPGGSCIITEYFRAGTVPADTCEVHEKVKICKETGMVANEFCPKDQVEEKIFRVRPNDVDGTAAIDPSAFEGCESLSSVAIPAGITEIAE